MNRITNIFITLGLILSISHVSCKKEIRSNDLHGKKEHETDKLSNQVILDWSNVAFEAAGGASEGHPLLASRIEAMMHIAIHDALNAIVPVYGSYIYKSHQYNLANPFAAAASAAHTVLKASWPNSALMLDAKLSASLSGIADGNAKTQGIALGIAAGNAILALRAGDGAFQNPVTDVPVSTVPGVYNAVPPNNFMYGAFWKTMQLFSLKTHDQFRSSPPPALSSPVYAKDFNEIKEVGKIISSVRTADQSTYANFWYEFADIGWNRIARIQAKDHNTDLYTTARIFALLNIALADTYIAFFDSKYFYYTWRPYTAIRAAGTDGNDKTVADPDWVSFLITPPIPEYPSGHSALGNAASIILSHFFGHNSSFTTTSTTASVAGYERSFKSFKQAADENAGSRVIAGIHFRFACDAGQKMGDKIGKWTLDNYLKPLH
jgi:membrane-associated phospholipid phosphatase